MLDERECLPGSLEYTFTNRPLGLRPIPGTVLCQKGIDFPVEKPPSLSRDSTTNPTFYVGGGSVRLRQFSWVIIVTLSTRRGRRRGKSPVPTPPPLRSATSVTPTTGVRVRIWFSRSQEGPLFWESQGEIHVFLTNKLRTYVFDYPDRVYLQIFFFSETNTNFQIPLKWRESKFCETKEKNFIVTKKDNQVFTVCF